MMARVSISEATRLIKVSRPTIYKMRLTVVISSALHLCYHKAQEGLLKLLIHQSLLSV